MSSAGTLLSITVTRCACEGNTVLDLGCAPGAWLQVACQALGPGDKGLVLGVDLQSVAVPKKHCDRRVLTLQADVTTLSESELRAYSPQVPPHRASCLLALPKHR